MTDRRRSESFGIYACCIGMALVSCSSNPSASGEPLGGAGTAVASSGGAATSTQGGSATGRQASGVGGSSQAAAGGAAIGLGGAAPAGGAVASGGRAPTGSASALGGTLATGSATQMGGASVQGGATSLGGTTALGGAATGGASAPAGGSVGGRGAGLCPGGSYPAPNLGVTPTRIYSSGTSGLFEGTVWHAASGQLLFSNMSTSSSNPIVPSQLQALLPPANVSTKIADSGSNGLALDHNGDLLGCSHKVQGIVRFDMANGNATTVVNTDANGKHFNSPNDLTVRTDGTIYFTDPDYQLGSSRSSETSIKGVYRVTPAKQVSLVDGSFGQPNGIALSPDQTVLYVADMNANAVRKFTVAADGSVGGKTNFASVTSPDGVTVDCAGNLYWASNSAGKVVVLSPTGTQLGSLTVGANATNLAFGGAEHKTLYISAGTAIYSVAMNVPGLPY